MLWGAKFEWSHPVGSPVRFLIGASKGRQRWFFNNPKEVAARSGIGRRYPYKVRLHWHFVSLYGLGSKRFCTTVDGQSRRTLIYLVLIGTLYRGKCDRRRHYDPTFLSDWPS